MMKRGILVIIMMISTLGLFSFKNNANDAKKTSFASYYHDKFNGRKTASGEVFSNTKLTAAHRTLPFGTEIKVTNPATGKSVIVEVNDRGPFNSSRGLDLSKAAFNSIGSVSKGTMPVEYEIVDND